MAVQVNHSKLELARQPVRHCLDDRQAKRMGVMRPGDEIVVTRGVLWITQQGDPDDHLVQKGQTYTPAGRGLVVVQAVRDDTSFFSRN